MKKMIFTAIALAASAFAFAQTPLPNDPEVRVGKLENGLTYYIRHNEKPAQRADFYLVSNVGAIQEGPGQDGLAHFLEHMCFNGLKNLPGKQMLDYLQSIGASFGGNINASTGVEVTQYMLNNIPVVREGVVDTCLLVMHDYSHFVVNDPVEIDNERGVILEEKRTRNTASWRMFEQSAPYLYGDTKYATTNIIGSEENLKTFKPETLVDFYQTWYRPDNQAVIVVGDIDVDQIEAKLVKLFADIPAPVNPRQKEVILIPDNVDPIIGVLTDAELTNNEIEIIWKRPAIPEEMNNTDQVFVLDLIDNVMSLVMSERFNDITSKPGAPFFSAQLGNGNLVESCDALMGALVYENGKDKEALSAFMYEVEKLKRYGVTEAEFQRAKDNLLSYFEKAAEGAESRKNPDFIRPLISAFTDNTSFMTPADSYQLAQMVLGQLNAAAVNQVVPQYITDENMVVLLEGVSTAEHPSEKEILDIILASRSAEIEAPAEEESGLELLDASRLKGSKLKGGKATVAGATEYMLKNGVRVVVLPTDYKKDEVIVKLVMPGGESTIATEDLYSFEDNIWSLYLQNTGIGQFTSNEVNKILAGKNAHATPVINLTNHGISASAAPKDIETAFQLMYMFFTQPRFDSDEFQIGIDRINAVLPNMEADPMFQLQKRIPEDIYGGNPRRFTISEDVVAKASVEHLEKAYRQLFKDAAGATVYVVGNVDMDQLKPLLEKYVGSLPKGKKAASWVDDGARFRSGEFKDHFSVPMTTPKASVIQVYSAKVPSTVENRLLLNAVSYVLDMTYVNTLREEEGGTYGASVSQEFIRRPYELALIQVYFDTNTEQAAALEALVEKGLRELAENGPSDEFFGRTIERFKTALPQNRISNSYWMGVLNNYYEFNENTDAEQEAAINALTKEKIADMAKTLLESKNYIEIEMMPAE